MAKVTIMVLKVDLQCCKCYKKVKKVLCKFPQIRDQVYDEKKNTVTIKVVCSCPEEMKRKICYKSGKSIKSIEINPPVKDKETKPTSEKPPQSPKPHPVPLCYYGCYGRPVFDSWGGCNRGYYWSRELFCEENFSACSIL